MAGTISAEDRSWWKRRISFTRIDGKLSTSQTASKGEKIYHELIAIGHLSSDFYKTPV